MIEVSSLTREYVVKEKESGLFVTGKKKRIVALKDLNLTAREGDAIGILGSNGAGKSTFIKLLSGIISPTQGDIMVDSKYVPFEKKRDYLSKITLVSGNKTQLNYDLSPKDNFYFLGALYGLKRKDIDTVSVNLCERLNCLELLDRQVRKLSFGERLKMEIIAALLHNPRYVFLDEPTIGLDIKSQIQLREFIKEYSKGDRIIFLTSHNLDDISEVCNKLLFIEKGMQICFEDIETFCKKYCSLRNLTIVTRKEIPMALVDFLANNNVHIQEKITTRISMDIETDRLPYILRELLNMFSNDITEINMDDSGVSSILRKRILSN